MARISDYDDGGLPTDPTEFVVARLGTTRKLTWQTIKSYISGSYLAAGGGVTNGNSHAHATGDGATLDHANLLAIGTNTHAQIDAHIALPRMWSILFPDSETIDNSITLHVSNLTLFGIYPTAMVSGLSYAIRGFYWYYTTLAAGFRIRVESYPNYTGVISYQYQEPGGAITIAKDTSFPSTTFVFGGLATGVGWIRWDGIITPTIDMAYVGPQWAQGTADASNTTVRGGSYFEIEPMG